MSADTLNTICCPAEKDLKSFVSDPFRTGNSDVAAHVYACEHCQRKVESILYPESECALSDEDKRAIGAFVKEHCGRKGTLLERLNEFVSSRQTRFFASDDADWRMAAAANGAVSMKPPHGGAAAACEDVRFVFASEDGVAPKEVWRAELDIPGSAAWTDMLSIRISDKDGVPVDDGLFTIAGTTLIVEKGQSKIPFSNFLVGIRNSTVAYQRTDGAEVAGNLIFF